MTDFAPDPNPDAREFDVNTDRVSYAAPRLQPSTFAPEPHVQFEQWLQEAAAHGIAEPNAMVVGTADNAGHVATRTVLLRGYSADGFVFFTNYEGRKGRQLAENPYASACFPWIAQHRQVIVSGPVRRLDPAASDAYFDSRPRGSQIASAASPQSQVIESLDVLDTAMNELAERYPEPTPVPRPAHWGGFEIQAETIEFWQGNDNRLHDRLRYRRTDGGWVIERLAP